MAQLVLPDQSVRSEAKMFDAVPSAVWMVAIPIGFALGLLLAALLFRSACDLCSVDPPGWLMCFAIVIIAWVIGAAIGFPAWFIVAALSDASTTSRTLVAAMAAVASLPAQAMLIAVLYKLFLRIKFLKALLIWALQSLLSVLVLAVLLLLVVGGFTIVEGVSRLT